MNTVAKLRGHTERRQPPRLMNFHSLLRGRFFTGARAPDPAVERVSARDGRTFVVRAIRADDVAALRRGFDRLSAKEVRLRFLHPLNELPEPFALQLCDLDPDVAFAWVLADPDDAVMPEIHAVARAFVDNVLDQAEFAIVVEGSLAGQGFGKLLMHKVIDSARKFGATEVWSDVLIENGAMLGVCDSLGFKRSRTPHDPGILRVTLDLAQST